MTAQLTDRYEWKLLWRDSQRDEDGNFDGHSFYRDEVSGRVSIKDMSGCLPHLTDDGVLWIDRERPVVFDLVSYSGCDTPNRAIASLPVICERRTEKCHCMMRWGDAAKVVRELGLKVKVEGEVATLLRMAVEVACLAIEWGGE